MLTQIKSHVKLNLLTVYMIFKMLFYLSHIFVHNSLKFNTLSPVLKIENCQRFFSQNRKIKRAVARGIYNTNSKFDILK